MTTLVSQHPPTHKCIHTHMHTWMRTRAHTHTHYADMLCDCSPSTNLGHGDRTETKGILLAAAAPPPPAKLATWSTNAYALFLLLLPQQLTTSSILPNASHSCRYQFYFCMKVFIVKPSSSFCCSDHFNAALFCNSQ